MRVNPYTVCICRISARSLDWSPDISGPQEPPAKKTGSSGLSATLAAAGLADPDILALAQVKRRLLLLQQM